MKPRTLLTLRRSLDKARTALARRNPAQAADAILAAARSGPLAPRPTRLLWHLARRCLARSPGDLHLRLHCLFDSDASRDSILAGNDRRNRRLFLPALDCYAEALASSPLAPEALYKTGACYFDIGDWDASTLWLKLVPSVLPPSARTDQYLTHFVADSLFRLARIERGRCHILRSRDYALAALQVNPLFSLAAPLAHPAPPPSFRATLLGLLRSHSHPPHCLVCGASLTTVPREPIVLCARCSTPVHASCWSFLRRCPKPACTCPDYKDPPP